jgi:hypothetical protein
MTKMLLFFSALLALDAGAACMSPDIELHGKTLDQKKCSVIINLEEQYIDFETDKQMCTFNIDEETAQEIKENKAKKITAKGYSNWFDCKVKIFYNEKGHPYKAKLSSRLTLALTFKNDECIFED